MMTKVKPSILPGFMELLPSEQIKFNTILSEIKKSFELFGFNPMDTPIIEKLEILTSKGGGENEQQMYSFKKGDNDLALRFDLTVPLARYVSQYYNELTFPFKRYQIGKVYRGEKPQKGRFREFYQCDIDIIAKDTLDTYYDAEILATICGTFETLNFGEFIVKVNNRKILTGFLDYLELLDFAQEILRAIDKIDKIGLEEAFKIIDSMNIDKSKISQIKQFFSIQGTNDEILNFLQTANIKSEIYNEGLKELSSLNTNLKLLGIKENYWSLDLRIARGLDYYTGTVYETFLTQYPQIGSVCSGGRYENLASNFSEHKLPGVGVSIGLTRLFSQLLEANILSIEKESTTKLLIIPLEGGTQKAFELLNLCRAKNIPSEIFYDQSTSLKKKMDYANKLGIPYVCVIGSNEVTTNRINLKNMATGEKLDLDPVEITAYLI